MAAMAAASLVLLAVLASAGRIRPPMPLRPPQPGLGVRAGASRVAATKAPTLHVQASRDLATAALHAPGGTRSSGHFVGSAAPGLSGRARDSAPTARGAFPWETSSSEAAERAYAALTSAFPAAAERGSWLEVPCDKSTVMGRYDALERVVGEEIASEIVGKEPVLLLQEAEKTLGTLEYLKELETPEQTGEALSIVRKNPRILTVAKLELQRTKASLSGLAPSAAAIDFLRPLGPAGLSFAIVGTFILGLIVIRPIIYGVYGGPSIVSILLSPFAALFAMIPNPLQFLNDNGISPALLVLPIPILQVAQAIRGKFFS